MNVANLDLCKELYGLSGWYAQHFWYCKKSKSEDLWSIEEEPLLADDENNIPAYDLGFLLRKLPHNITPKDKRYSTGSHLELHNQSMDKSESLGGGISHCWCAMYRSTYGHLAIEHADTPEDAVCKLAIELFKQGIIKKEK